MSDQSSQGVVERSVEAAIRCLAAGMVAEAEALCASVLNILPTAAGAHACLAECAGQRGDGRGRRWHLAMAAALAPDDPAMTGKAEAELHGAVDLMRAAMTEALITRISAGDWSLAGVHARAAVGRDPGFAFGWKVLGASLMALGDAKMAAGALKRVIALQPDDAEAHANLADALHHSGEMRAALESATYAIGIDPSLGEAYLTAARACIARKEWEKAVSFLQDLLVRHPDDTQAPTLLAQAQDGLASAASQAPTPSGQQSPRLGLRKADGRTLKRARQELVKLFNSGQFSALETAALGWTRRYPEVAFHWHALGLARARLGKTTESIAPYREAIRLMPDDAELQNNLAISLVTLGRLEEATEACEHALSCAPDYLPALNNLGVILQKQHRFADAAETYRQVVERDPQHCNATRNLGNVLKDMGRLAEGLEWYRRSLKLDPKSFEAWSNLLFSSNYLAAESVECLRELATQFAEVAAGVCGKPSAEKPPARTSPEALRVGFVSGDLHSHPVAYFLEKVLAHLDHTRITPLAFVTYDKTDLVTDRLKPRFAAWRRLVGLSDAEAAELIVRENVDVLIDLSGHSGYNRLPMFVHRPAPLQVTWLGYFATTGLAEMDYIIGDPYVTPPTEARHFVERVWRLPETYLCFSPPNLVVDPGPLPWLGNGYPTFGCFNNLPKLNDRVIDLWCRILLVVPEARLFLKTKQLGDAAVRTETMARFAARGVDPARLVLEGHAPRGELLASYRRVDVCLDPFPYPGGTTSIEALWMGVPVITLRGDRFLSHVGETIAHNAGLSDWIAEDEPAYLVKAIATCANPAALSELRASLRARVLASPLFDAERFARNFEAALFGMWREKFGEKT